MATTKADSTLQGCQVSQALIRQNQSFQHTGFSLTLCEQYFESLQHHLYVTSAIWMAIDNYNNAFQLATASIVKDTDF